MGLAYDLVVAGVIFAISAFIHLISTELFAPENVLYRIATDGTSVMNGGELAWQWTQILVIWVPVAGIIVAVAWPFMRAYRRQASTAASQARP